jgi:hypothetical protein
MYADARGLSKHNERRRHETVPWLSATPVRLSAGMVSPAAHLPHSVTTDTAQTLVVEIPLSERGIHPHHLEQVSNAQTSVARNMPDRIEHRYHPLSVLDVEGWWI